MLETELMRVLAIFTCYNRRELTKQSMELLGQNKNVTFDYVIVNDGSTDGDRKSVV